MRPNPLLRYLFTVLLLSVFVPCTAPAQALQAGRVIKDCATCPELVVVPAGSFMMGSKDGPENEKPVRRVSIKTFAMGVTEVTQAQWQAVMGSNPSGFKDCGPTCPVENVSWDHAQEFIKKLNARTGQTYRLPSEAEWEYAARAESTTRYWWGDEASRDYANYGRDQCCKGFAQGRDQWVTTAPVAKFPANRFGLHDMHGNVWEWVEDVWHDNYVGAPTDGNAWTTGVDTAQSVLRSSSWVGGPGLLRSAARTGYAPGRHNDGIGFRIARTL